MKKDFSSLIVLILVNIIPIAGVLFWGWSPIHVVYLYWIETLIIGLVSPLKILIAAKPKMHIFVNVILAGIFIFTFGIFCGIQGLIIMILGNSYGDVMTDEGVLDTTLELQEINQSFSTLFWPAVLMFGSHLFSFYYNFIGKKEYQKSHAVTLMAQPFARIYVQQFVAIFGAWLALTYARGILMMLLVIVAKTFADAWAHLREHKSKVEETIVG